MPLDLPPSSRFPRQPEPLPDTFVAEARELLLKISYQGERQPILEQFKGHFCRAIGRIHHWSSSTDFAEYDLNERMQDAKKHAPLFLEALYDCIETLRTEGRYHVPDIGYINDVCRSHGVPYVIEPPNLIRIVPGQPAVVRPTPPPTLTENAANVLNASMNRAEELLAEGRSREAVQEILWMLESLVTTFRGATLPTGEIRGGYFNQIAKELRAGASGTTLDRVVDWVVQLHGYLSSPTGGGVRHGLDLHSGTPISLAEARLFVNLVLSYVSFLLAEHARLTARNAG